MDGRALALLGVAAAAAAGLMSADASAQQVTVRYVSGDTVVCGDRLCAEIPGGYSAWKRDGAAAYAAPAPAPAAPAAPAAADPPGPEYAAEPETHESTVAAAEAALEASGWRLPFDLPPPVTVQLAENVYYFNWAFYTSLIVVSQDGVLVTDPANDVRASVLAAEVARITDAPVTAVVLSHEHYDHAGGTSAFGEAEVVCHANCAAVFDLEPFGAVPEADIEFDDRLAIDMGGTLVELHYLGPSDGEANTVVYLPEEGVLLTTDLYSPRRLTPAEFMDDVNYAGLRHVLNTVKEWPVAHAVTAHGVGSDPAGLHEAAGFVDDLYDAALGPLDAARAGGMFAVLGLMETLPGTLELERYAGWDGYEEDFPRHVERMLAALSHGD